MLLNRLHYGFEKFIYFCFQQKQIACIIEIIEIKLCHFFLSCTLCHFFLVPFFPAPFFPVPFFPTLISSPAAIFVLIGLGPRLVFIHFVVEKRFIHRKAGLIYFCVPFMILTPVCQIISYLSSSEFRNTVYEPMRRRHFCQIGRVRRLFPPGRSVLKTVKSCVSAVVCHQSAGHRRVQTVAMACLISESNFRFYIL